MRIASWSLKTKWLAILGILVGLYLVYWSRVLIGYVRVAAEARSIKMDASRRDHDASQISFRLSRESPDTFRAVFRNNGPKALYIIDPAELTNKPIFDVWGQKTPWSGLMVISKPPPEKRNQLITLPPASEIEFTVYQSRLPQGYYPMIVGRLMVASYDSFPVAPGRKTAPMVNLAGVSICSNAAFL